MELPNASKAKAEPERVPRQYQLDIVEQAVKGNVITLLPTGSGKTFVATLVIKDTADKLLHRKQLAVFVVPTKVLVSSHAFFEIDCSHTSHKASAGKIGVTFRLQQQRILH
ncbi:hypothetical protein CYMTET_12787 [Cymbomonas tetramitiformis]|uniref:DEAD/DEAH-box helicase domain-containing protein n=1 Tax=Cymbomonas tetramitiformis TaxID=36881 RepID=A0AAE0GJL3_9CHLO|nr:hypothetical protein CYMTET_12787 [Cymbomonas tetramitiformis]